MSAISTFKYISKKKFTDSICIITPDLVGFVRNGGVGTACTEFSKVLAKNGIDVTVLFSQVGALAGGSEAIDEAKASYRRHSIELVIAEEWGGEASLSSCFPPNPLLRMSRIIHEWLKEQQFDLVLFMDWQGNGYYPLMARQAGLAHQQHGAFAVICHGPSLWSDLGNGTRRRDPLDAITYFIERRSIEMADLAISPSRYLLQWMHERGFKLPSRTLVRPNLLETPLSTRAAETPEEVVFFGRLEYRKGIVQFCSAIDRLVARGEVPKQVVFLGKLGFVGEEHAAIYLARRSRGWPMPVEILSRLGQPEALDVLKARRCVAVIPSTVENSPYTVYECLMAGVPVIARDVGGIAELYAPEHHKTHLFNDNPNSLADKLADALSGRLPKARLSFSPEENYRQWTEELPALVEKIKTEHTRKLASESQPLVSICLTHYRRPKLLLQAVQGILTQTYQNIEVILVDDGSNEPETALTLSQLEAHPSTQDWHIKRVTNGFPGRARNLAAAEANGAYLLFLDDDNVAKPTMVETLVTAGAQSGADIVTCFAAVFEGDDTPGAESKVVDTYMPVGGALGYALAGNAISDTSALIKRNLFDELNGFTEDYGIGHEDFELFLRAALKEKNILVVPEALYWYRRQTSSIGSATPHSANRSRSFRPFLEYFGPDMVELLVVMHGLVDSPAPEEPHNEQVMHESLTALKQHDPDSWQSIDIASSVLAASGATALAKQLLSQVSESTPNAQLRHLRVGLIDALQSTNINRLKYIFRQARGMDNSSLLELVSLASRIAWNQRLPFTADLMKYWISLDTGDLEPRLLLVEALGENGQTGEAFRNFAEALKVADHLYRKKRPDVDAAIIKGGFEMGLEHYAIHGLHENAPWPNVLNFRRIANQLYCSLEGKYLSGSQEFSKLIHLSFSVFSTGKKIHVSDKNL